MNSMSFSRRQVPQTQRSRRSDKRTQLHALPQKLQDVFNREQEVSMIHRIIDSPQPKLVNLLYGPQNTGKTYLLRNTVVLRQQHVSAKARQELLQKTGLQQADEVVSDTGGDALSAPAVPANVSSAAAELTISSKQHILYIDLRLHDVSTPSSFAKVAAAAIDDLIPNLLATLQKGTDVTLKWENGKTACTVSAYSFKDVPQPDLNTVLNLLRIIAAAGLTANVPPPVIALDEVNMLDSWADKYADALDTLMSALVAFGKQLGDAGGAHVFLATSSSAYVMSLHEQIGGAYMRHIFVDNFTQEQALQFLLKIAPPNLHVSLRKDLEGIYEVLGGNPGALSALVVTRDPHMGGWKAEAQELAAPVSRGLEFALAGERNQWTPKQVLHALQRAMQPGGIRFKDLCDELDGMGGNGQQAVLALMEAYILGLRPGPDDRVNMVVPGSAQIRYWMEEDEAFAARLKKMAPVGPSPSSDRVWHGELRVPHLFE